MRVLIFYNGEFGQRLAGNLINYSGFCISCGEACSQCRSGKFSSAEDIVAIYEMPDPSTLGDFIDDVDPLLPRDLPEADIAVVVNVHPDILFGLLPRLKDLGVKGIV
jgi:thymidylate synthase